MQPAKKRRLKLLFLALIPIVGFSLVILYRFAGARPGGWQRTSRVMTWLRSTEKQPDWAITALQRCGNAPFLLPTSGLVGFLWDDSFRIGHRHQGIDIFGAGSINKTPVYAAYDGYLTRRQDWKASVIMRIPQDPLQPERQIWVYYTHMADEQGNSFISSQFPPGTTEVFVEAGTLLGYQGNFSGNPGNPVGVHLHFSIVLDDGEGGFLNELKIQNTLDPSPYLGLELNAWKTSREAVVCRPSE